MQSIILLRNRLTSWADPLLPNEQSTTIICVSYLFAVVGTHRIHGRLHWPSIKGNTVLQCYVQTEHVCWFAVMSLGTRLYSHSPIGTGVLQVQACPWMCMTTLLAASPFQVWTCTLHVFSPLGQPLSVMREAAYIPIPLMRTCLLIASSLFGKHWDMVAWDGWIITAGTRSQAAIDPTLRWNVLLPDLQASTVLGCNRSNLVVERPPPWSAGIHCAWLARGGRSLL